jgi:hypothetical protein
MKKSMVVTIANLDSKRKNTKNINYRTDKKFKKQGVKKEIALKSCKGRVWESSHHW